MLARPIMPGVTQARPPSLPGSEPLVSRRLRPYGAALVPLALAGLLPWWAVALLCAVSGLGARFQAWQDARFLVSLLIAGAATLPGLAALRGSGNGEALLDLGSRYLILLLALGLSSYGLTALEHGRRRGLAALLCAGLFAPQPLLLPALVGGALLRPGTDDRLGRPRPRPAAERAAGRRGWGLVLAGVAALTLLALALPRSGVPTAAASLTATDRPPTTAPAQPPQEAATPLTGTARRRPAVTSGAGGLPQPPAELLLLAGALTFAALGALVWRRRQGRGARVPPTLTELLMAGGLLLTLALLLVFSLGGTRGAGGDAGAPLSPAPTGGAASSALPLEQVGTSSGVSALLWVLLALQVLLAAALLWVLWRHRTGREKLAVAGDEAGDPQVPAVPNAVPATHRVRAAYRQAEAGLAAAGQGRAAAEAPGAYAARVGAAFSELAAPLETLTRLYGPVRYGGRLSEAEAEDAEAAAARIAAWAARRPSSRPSPFSEDLP